MMMIRPICRAQFAAEDIDFILSVLAGPRPSRLDREALGRRQKYIIVARPAHEEPA